jgi:hypothetical protein
MSTTNVVIVGLTGMFLIIRPILKAVRKWL